MIARRRRPYDAPQGQHGEHGGHGAARHQGAEGGEPGGRDGGPGRDGTGVWDQTTPMGAASAQAAERRQVEVARALEAQHERNWLVMWSPYNQMFHAYAKFTPHRLVIACGDANELPRLLRHIEAGYAIAPVPRRSPQ